LSLTWLWNHYPHSLSGGQYSRISLLCALLAFEFYAAALIAILLNRLADGLDGAVARRTQLTDAGGYIDVVLDFIFYSAVVFGFLLASPEQHAVAAGVLLVTFMGTGSTFLAFAAFCLWPQHFAVLAYIFAAACWITAITRIVAGYRTLKKGAANSV